jgi:dTDP-4-dehydrorhamnose 3,5-epimerase
MHVIETGIPDVRIFVPKKFGDHRGFFAETYSSIKHAAAGIHTVFVQDNHSLSVSAGVVRGLHYQVGEMAQAKLVRVIRGAILDVAVDVRRGSPTFGQHVADMLSADNFRQIYVPAGFAHGFATLEPNTEVVYKVDKLYSPAHERGILWNDPDLKIDWTINMETAVLSDRDRKHPRLKDAVELFE